MGFSRQIVNQDTAPSFVRPQSARTRRPSTNPTRLAQHSPDHGVQTIARFMAQTFPPKEPLVEGLIHRRDLVALGARRRHGKTTFLLQLAMDLAAGEPQFLGYAIPQSRRSLLFLLEDDPQELQEKISKAQGDRQLGNRIALYTREDFLDAGIPIDQGSQAFHVFVEEQALAHRPDVIVFDNLAHLVGADYNDHMKMHALGSFAYQLARDHGTAVVIAAHPRKNGQKHEDQVSLEHCGSDGTQFFESIMGSSHFINSMGCLWGLERTDERSLFLGGRQRGDGFQQLSHLEFGDDRRFTVVSEVAVQRAHVLNTAARLSAWDKLPLQFGFSEGRDLTKDILRAKRSYSEWVSHCVRLHVLVKTPDGKYQKATS